MWVEKKQYVFSLNIKYLANKYYKVSRIYMHIYIYIYIYIHTYALVLYSLAFPLISSVLQGKWYSR